jgi:hypothetical protein
MFKFSKKLRQNLPNIKKPEKSRFLRLLIFLVALTGQFSNHFIGDLTTLNGQNDKSDLYQGV